MTETPTRVRSADRAPRSGRRGRTTGSRDGAGGDVARDLDRWATPLFAAASLLLVGVAWHVGRTLWWFSDDWNIIARYHDGHLLEPFNGHLSVVPVAIFRVLYETVGLDHYGPYRAVGLACYVGFGAVLFAYARRQVPPLVAALGTLLLLWLSVAGFNVTFPFLVNFTIPLAATIAAWWLLEHDEPRRDVAAAVCVGVALASSGLGVVTAMAVATELAWRRAPVRRWLPHAVPVGLWTAWYLGWSETTAEPDSVGQVLDYARHELAATFWALGGTNRVVGAVVAATVVAVVAAAALRWKTFDARAASALVAFAGFIGLTAFSRVGIVPHIPPDTGRYLWVNVVYLLVALAACLRGRRWPAVAVAALAALVVFNGVVLVKDLRAYKVRVDTYAATVRMHLVANQLAGDAVPRERILPLSMLAVDSGAYQDAVDHLGSPVDGVTEGDLGPDGSEREQVDIQLAADLAPTLGRTDTVPCSGAQSAAVTTADADSTLTVTAGATDTVVRLQRLSRQGGAELGVVPAGTTRTLTLPADADAELGGHFPWRVVTDPAASVARCP